MFLPASDALQSNPNPEKVMTVRSRWIVAITSVGVALLVCGVAFRPMLWGPVHQDQPSPSAKSQTPRADQRAENTSLAHEDGPVAQLPVEDPDALLDGGWPKIVAAAYRGDSDLVEELIRMGADIDLAGPMGWTALMQAAGHGYNEIVQSCIDAGAYLDAENDVHRTAYDLAVERGYPETAQRLADAGAMTPDVRTFINAVCRRDINELRRMIAAGHDVNRTDYRGRSALFYALAGDRLYRYHDRSFEFNTPLVKALLDAGADPGLQDREGANALYVFITEYGSSIEIVDLLLAHGARLESNGQLGQSLLHQFHGVEILDRCLAAGLDVNGRDVYGNTPLHYAIQKNQYSNVDQLLAAGADPLLRNESGLTAIDMFGDRPRQARMVEYWEKTRALLVERSLLSE